ncbi:MAG: nickel pincer cofactor biosynthesis protein LarB [Gammaproteobacteria bacterium]|nr:nickel pincer cofactor biosynthesis protein LarB [Gammaproteobacteria bacterium]
MVGDWDLTPDNSRKERLGFDETVFCASKTTDQINRLLQAAADAGETLLLTRLEPDKHAALSVELHARLDYDEISLTAMLGRSRQREEAPHVAIVSAGSSDVRVAREAARTLDYYGVGVHEIYDVGVAGLWRLLERVDELRPLPVVITVAGMEGTLPSVVAGLVPGVVIAVPVATGYGVAANGVTALHSALASCAPGLLVVNVDNGYGAGCAALRILNVMQRS